MSLFGEAVKFRREELGLDQLELGRRVGVGQQTVSRWETGAAVPKANRLSGLAEVLGLESVVLPQRGAVPNAREAVLRDRWAAVQRRDATVAAARAARHLSVAGPPRGGSAGVAAPPGDRPGLPLTAGERALVADVAPDVGFAAAAENALDLLHQLHAMDLWMVTAVQDGVERVVVARGAGGMPVPPGAVQPWAQSYCRVMVAGQGPRAAPRVRDVPAYAASPATERWGIGAYIGVPLLTGDGALFGVLCGLSAAEQDHRLDDVLGEVERVARLLSTLLAKERAALERSQAAAQAYALADRDPVTGVLNRRAGGTRGSRRRRSGAGAAAASPACC